MTGSWSMSKICQTAREWSILGMPDGVSHKTMIFSSRWKLLCALVISYPLRIRSKACFLGKLDASLWPLCENHVRPHLHKVTLLIHHCFDLYSRFHYIYFHIQLFTNLQLRLIPTDWSQLDMFVTQSILNYRTYVLFWCKTRHTTVTFL